MTTIVNIGLLILFFINGIMASINEKNGKHYKAIINLLWNIVITIIIMGNSIIAEL